MADENNEQESATAVAGATIRAAMIPPPAPQLVQLGSL